jgi:hypothetical protein
VLAMHPGMAARCKPRRGRDAQHGADGRHRQRLPAGPLQAKVVLSARGETRRAAGNRGPFVLTADRS